MQGESLRAICASEGMPDKTTVLDWLAKEKDFSTQYAHAKEVQMDLMAEEILDIADDGTNDWMEKKDDEDNCIGWRENGEAVQRSKLRVDTRKWLMSKLAPKKYGEKQEIKHSGSIGLEALVAGDDGDND